MLQIPFKRGRKANIAYTGKNYISSVFGRAEAAGHESALAALNQQRIDVSALASPNEGARQALYKYLHQIDCIKDKLPVSVSQMKIAFMWDDSFSGKHTTGVYSWAYERASVLFNVAALESQIGASTPRTTAEGIKTAAKQFQKAAGILTHIRDHVITDMLGVMPLDLKPEGLDFHIHNMLGQAQLCMFEMGANHLRYSEDKLARIAIAAADEFRRSRACITPANSGMIERAYPYSKHLEAQAASMDAVAYMHQAAVVLARAQATTEGYGEHVAVLDLARRAAEHGRAIIASNTKVQIDPRSISSVAEDLKRKHAVAQDENTSIYRQVIPEAKKLAPIAAALLARPSVLPDMTPSAGGSDLFATLVPPAVSKAVAELEAKQAEFATTLRAEVAEKTESCKAVLASMGLPASLDVGDSTSGIPDAIWTKCEFLRINGGGEELEKLVAANTAANAEVEAELAAAESCMRTDYEQHETNKARFGAAWTPVDHQVMMAEHIQRLMNFRSVAKQFAARDAEIASNVRAKLPEISKIATTDRASLASEVPEATPGAGGESERSQLRAELVGLAELHTRRTAALEAVIDAVDKGSIASSCLKHAQAAGRTSVVGPDDVATVWAELASLRAGPEAELAAIAAEEAERLERITVLNTRYTETRAMDSATASRQTALQALHAATDEFEKLRTSLREQQALYADIKREAAKLNKDAADTGYVRDIERRQLLVSLGAPPPAESGAGGAAAASASSAGTAFAVPPP